MSIIIKGMKMPKKEGDYDARLHVNRDGTALFYLYKECGAHPAKELPPHGDLIDAEEQMRLMQSYDYDTYDDYSRAFDMLDNAPTIIERETDIDAGRKKEEEAEK